MARDVDMVTWFEALVDEVDDSVVETAEEVAEFGAQTMEDMIESRGTGKTWQRSYVRGGVRRRASKPGRVWTGQMRDDITYFADRKSDTVAVAEAGWLDQYEEYYGLQEGGFDHPISGEKIKGMFIMADTADLMRRKADTLLGAKLRAI